LYTFYHGCLDYAAHSICLNGLGLNWGHSKGSDFGPGVYVGRNILDALRVAEKRASSRPTNKPDDYQMRPACVVFQCKKEQFDSFSILQLQLNNIDPTANR
jgi:hypothetical protein